MQMSWQHRATEQSIGSLYPELHEVKERTLLLMLRAPSLLQRCELVLRGGHLKASWSGNRVSNPC